MHVKANTLEILGNCSINFSGLVKFPPRLGEDYCRYYKTTKQQRCFTLCQCRQDLVLFAFTFDTSHRYWTQVPPLPLPFLFRIYAERCDPIFKSRIRRIYHGSPDYDSMATIIWFILVSPKYPSDHFNIVHFHQHTVHLSLSKLLNHVIYNTPSLYSINNNLRMSQYFNSTLTLRLMFPRVNKIGIQITLKAKPLGSTKSSEFPSHI